MHRRTVLHGLVALGASLLTCRSAGAALLPGKILHHGWLTPLVPTIAASIAAMEAVPFDGLVIDPDKINGNNTTGTRLGWQMWRLQEVDLARWEPEIALLEATAFTRFTDNFLPVRVSTPSPLLVFKRWYSDDEWAFVLRNATKMATVVKRLGFKGVLLDTEWYETPTWQYPLQCDAADHPYVEYGSKVRQRGREFLQAVRAGYAHCTVLATYGYSLAWRPPILGGTVATSKNGLLPFFLDGMLEAMASPQLLYDGYESAYGFTTEAQFVSAYNLMHQQCQAWSAPDVQVKFRQHYRASQGLWIDFQSNNSNFPWDPTLPETNYFTPEQFEASLRLALRYSDKYVWVYSQRANWWDGSMAAYQGALTSARSV